MPQTGNDMSGNNNNPRKLTRQTLVLLLISLLLPITGFGVMIYIRGGITRSNILVFLLFLLSGVLIAILLSLYVKKQIVQPIRGLTEQVNQLAQGEFEPIKLIQRRDELGKLSEAIKDAGEKIKSYTQNLETENVNLSKQSQIAAEIARFASTNTDLSEILQHSVNLVGDHFSHDRVDIYLIEPKSKTISLEATSEPKNKLGDAGLNLVLPQKSIVGWVVANNQLRYAPNVHKDPHYSSSSGKAAFQSEAAIPITFGGEVLGALDLLDTKLDPFTWDEITILQTITDQLAYAIYFNQLRQEAQLDRSLSSILFKASNQITAAESREAVFKGLIQVLYRLPFPSALFLNDKNSLHCVFITDPDGKPDHHYYPILPIEVEHLTQILQIYSPLNLDSVHQYGEDIPEAFEKFWREIGYRHSTIFPLFIGTWLTGVLFLGSPSQEPLGTITINAIKDILEISQRTLETLRGLNTLKNRIREFEILNTISQSISAESSLSQLYEVIHHQILQVMGDVHLLIALYSEKEKTIEIPYAVNGDEIVSVPPFPLGEGLTSIVIRTREPLMIVEDTVRRSRALGAIITDDQPAQSWLGVPIIAGQEVLGALVVQDLERENRFDENDRLLLTSLASQIAIAIRNTQLIEETRRYADHEQTISQVSSKFSRSLDIENILKTAVKELGQLPDVVEASIQIKDPRQNGDSKSP